MLKRLNDFLAGLPMTIAGGVFLVISFAASKAGISMPADPAWITVIICGIPLLYLAVWRVFFNKGISKISSALLICIAMLAAIAVGDLFAAGEVVFIMEIGAILEDMTTERAKKGMKKLMNLAPAQGRRITDGKAEMIAADQIMQGDILRILPGEAIPADGVILCGETSVDQSVMTGESLPVDKTTGDEVFCGTINRFGAIDIRATRVGEYSSLKRLIGLVRDAEKNQAPMQRIADKCASLLVPIALLIAIAVGIFTKDLVRAVTILVVFCPCALVLATPTAIMAAIGQAAKRGVIIKSGEALERMGNIHTIAFDKTGTLTLGALTVSDIIPLDKETDETRLAALAASAEQRSEHPLGRAVVDYATAKNLPLTDATSFQMQSGRGICAVVSGVKLFCGNESYIRQNHIPLSPAAVDALENVRAQGKASIIVADQTHCLGILALSDVLRPEAPEMVRRLSAMRTHTLLLTGDNEKAAACFAAQAGIHEVKANLLPEEKAACIAALQENGEFVCMIGDGVNDAPALKTAQVGVALGSMGSDIAVEAADIALMSDDLSNIPYLKKLSDATIATIKGSITLSMCINAVAVTCSALGILNPTTGALVHNAGSCFVVLLAALLYDRKF